MFIEDIPTLNENLIKSASPLEQWSVTKDTTDYLWHTTRYANFNWHFGRYDFICSHNCNWHFVLSISLDGFHLPLRENVLPVLRIASLGHMMHGFVNGHYIGILFYELLHCLMSFRICSRNINFTREEPKKVAFAFCRVIRINRFWFL